MAKHRHISVSFSVAALTLLTLSSPLSTMAEEYGGGGGSEWEDGGGVSFAENTPITWKYGLMWTKSSLKAPRKCFTPITVLNLKHKCRCCPFNVYSTVSLCLFVRCHSCAGWFMAHGKPAAITSLDSLENKST